MYIETLRVIQYGFVSLLLLSTSPIWAESDATPIENPSENRVPAIQFKDDPLLKGMPENVLSFSVVSAQELFDAVVSEVVSECAYKWRPLQKVGEIEDACFDSMCGTNLLCREASIKRMQEDWQRLLDGE